MRKQQLIVNLLRHEVDQADRTYRQAIAERAAAIAAANAWDDYNSGKGIGTSQNPYDLNRVDQREMGTKNRLADLREAYDYAVDTFIKGNCGPDGCTKDGIAVDIKTVKS